MRTTSALLSLLLTMSVATADDWSQWRGPERTGRSAETGLLQDWPTDGPKLVWHSDVAGLGYAGMAVVGDSLYTLGSRGNEEYLIALNTSDGKEKWSTKVGLLLTNNWGDGPRSTPTVVGGQVFAMSGVGNLVCANAADGAINWQVSMTDDLGGKVPGWGYTESPLVDGDKVLCTPGGAQGAVTALNTSNGDVVWRSRDFTDKAQYSSIILVDNNTRQQYVQLVMNSLVGLDANDGSVLWRSDWPGRTAVVPTPIYHNSAVYITSGYGVGCKLVDISSGQAKTAYENKVMKNHHGGVVRVGEHLYGYSDGPGWVCQDFESGDMVWNEKRALGKGCLTYADNRFYLQDESSGTIVLIAASPKGWQEHGRFTLSPQTKLRKPKGKVWTHPTIANGKLYLRDQELVFCYDIAG